MPLPPFSHESSASADDDPGGAGRPDEHAWQDRLPGNDAATGPAGADVDTADFAVGPADATQAAAEGYWALSRTPLTSLVFALPLVLAYEGGVLLLGRGSPRNGADVWLRQFLDLLGFEPYFLLPTLTVLGLLAWHHVEHDRWCFRPGVLLGMALESCLWAAALLGLARQQERLWPLAAGLDDGFLARLIGFCGAGLYEEVLFRLLLLPVLGWVLERAGFGTVAASLFALVGSSLLFSLAHYVGPLGDTFELYSFTFRFLAGMFFAVLFTWRGFGIAAGAHAAYDMLVGLV